VALAVLLDAEREVAKAPVLALGDLAAMVLDDGANCSLSVSTWVADTSWREMNTFS